MGEATGTDSQYGRCQSRHGLRGSGECSAGMDGDDKRTRRFVYAPQATGQDEERAAIRQDERAGTNNRWTRTRVHIQAEGWLDRNRVRQSLVLAVVAKPQASLLKRRSLPSGLWDADPSSIFQNCPAVFSARADFSSPTAMRSAEASGTGKRANRPVLNPGNRSSPGIRQASRKCSSPALVPSVRERGVCPRYCLTSSTWGKIVREDVELADAVFAAA